MASLPGIKVTEQYLDYYSRGLIGISVHTTLSRDYSRRNSRKRIIYLAVPLLLFPALS